MNRDEYQQYNLRKSFTNNSCYDFLNRMLFCIDVEKAKHVTIVERKLLLLEQDTLHWRLFPEAWEKQRMAFPHNHLRRFATTRR